MSARPIGTVLFDWNGTLVDDTTRAFVCANTVLADLELPELLDVAAFRHHFTLPLNRWMSVLGVPPEHLGNAVARWNQQMALRDAPARSGAVELLGHLRELGYRTGVVSAASSDAVRSDADTLGLAPLLDTIDGDASPKRHTITARRYDGATARCFYVGDTEYDITEAIAAGSHAVGLSAGYRPGPALAAAGAHHVIGGLAEIPALLATASPRSGELPHPLPPRT